MIDADYFLRTLILFSSLVIEKLAQPLKQEDRLYSGRDKSRCGSDLDTSAQFSSLTSRLI